MWNISAITSLVLWKGKGGAKSIKKSRRKSREISFNLCKWPQCAWSPRGPFPRNTPQRRSHYRLRVEYIQKSVAEMRYSVRSDSAPSILKFAEGESRLLCFLTPLRLFAFALLSAFCVFSLLSPPSPWSYKTKIRTASLMPLHARYLATTQRRRSFDCFHR